jgi:hypothetical protein
MQSFDENFPEVYVVPTYATYLPKNKRPKLVGGTFLPRPSSIRGYVGFYISNLD